MSSHMTRITNDSRGSDNPSGCCCFATADCGLVKELCIHPCTRFLGRFIQSRPCLCVPCELRIRIYFMQAARWCRLMSRPGRRRSCFGPDVGQSMARCGVCVEGQCIEYRDMHVLEVRTSVFGISLSLLLLRKLTSDVDNSSSIMAKQMTDDDRMKIFLARK